MEMFFCVCKELVGVCVLVYILEGGVCECVFLSRRVGVCVSVSTDAECVCVRTDGGGRSTVRGAVVGRRTVARLQRFGSQSHVGRSQTLHALRVRCQTHKR